MQGAHPFEHYKWTFVVLFHRFSKFMSLCDKYIAIRTTKQNCKFFKHHYPACWRQRLWKLYERTCPTLLTCEPPLEQVEELGHKCKHCFSGTVVKVLPHRIPGGKLSSFLPVFTYRAVGVSIIACCSRLKSKYKFQDKTGMVSRVQSYKIYENGWKLL